MTDSPDVPDGWLGTRHRPANRGTLWPGYRAGGHRLLERADGRF